MAQLGQTFNRKFQLQTNYKLLGFDDTYILRKRNEPKRSKRDLSHLTRKLNNDDRVDWAEQQFGKIREKRDYNNVTANSNSSSNNTWVSQNNRFSDPLWQKEWYLLDTRTDMSLPELDLRVIPVWDMGITGKGIVVSILDDGLEHNHTDLHANYDPSSSYDANSNDSDPFPRYDPEESNRHGTRCAGEIAMIPNNNKCGVGVAYEAQIAGVRMLDGSVSDAVEAIALAFNVARVDIYSASWGPKDDGQTVEGPGKLAGEALERGIREGRKGKGVLYIWAGGNGGTHGDDCNCDGYTSSIYTISVASVTQKGMVPYYSEMCAVTLASTYSSGAYMDQRISTTDLHNACTTEHTGTSASAPLAAGVFALVLQANPELSWRDAQHLLIWTADPAPLLLQNNGWTKNGVGLLFHNHIGFGLMNAEAMVKTALKWKPVPQNVTCVVQPDTVLPIELSSTSKKVITFTTDGCAGTENEVNFLEHVLLTVDIEYAQRGLLGAVLISPFGTNSTVLSARPEDSSDLGFQDWTFMSIQFWGESVKGKWTFTIEDKERGNNKGNLSRAVLTLRGTKEKPDHMNTEIKRPELPTQQEIDAADKPYLVTWNDLFHKLTGY